MHRAAPRPRLNAHAAGGMCRRPEGGRVGSRRPPPRGRAGGPRRDPPPTPPHRPASRGGAPLPRGRGDGPPSPRQYRGAREGAGARPAPPPQPPGPTGTAENKRTRGNAPGRHTDRARRQQASTNRSGMGATPSMTRTMPVAPALLPAQGRQRDRMRQSDPPPHWPPGPHKQGGRRTGRPPPPTPAPSRGTPRTRRPTPRGAHDPKPGRGESGPGCPPPSTPNGALDRGGTGGGARTAWNRTTSVQRRDRARCARHTNRGREGGGSGRRGSASAHTHKGHAKKIRRATGLRSRNAQTAWNGVPASEGKGHPDGTASHTQRGTRGAGRGKRGRHHTRNRPKPTEPAAIAAHTWRGHCTRQSSSGALRHAPTPRLGSHRASPRGFHWRQTSSTDLAAPAPRATTH